MFQYKADYEIAKQKHLMAKEVVSQDRKFCAFVVSNDAGQPARRKMFELLSKYKKVDSGGAFLNNIGYCVPDKQHFLQNYKFCIAFENCVYPGYTTEKLLQAFAAGAIPIYYGNPRINEEFNTDSFINCHDYKSLDDVVSAVKQIDLDDSLYENMIRTPIVFKEDNYGELTDFLYSIMEQDVLHARRRPVNTRIAEVESYSKQNRVLRKINLPIKRFRNLMRRIRNHSVKT